MSSYYAHRGASYLSDRAPPPADPGTAAPLVLEDITPQFDNVHHSHSHSHRVKSRNTTTWPTTDGLDGTHHARQHPRHDSRSGRRALAVVEEQNVDQRSARAPISHVSLEMTDQQTHEKFPGQQPQAAVHPSSRLRSAHVEADPAFKPPSWLANASLGGDSVRSRQHDHSLQDPRYLQQCQEARLQEHQQHQQQQQQHRQLYARGQYLQDRQALGEHSDAAGSFRPEHAELLSQSHVDETVRREDLRRRSHDGLHRTHRQRLFDAALLDDGNDNNDDDDGAVHQHISQGTHHRHEAHRHKHDDRASAHHHSAAHSVDGHEYFMTHEVRKQNHGPHHHDQALTHLDRQGVGTTRPVRRTSRPLCLSQESSGKRSRDEDDAVASPDETFDMKKNKNEASLRLAQVPREPFGDTNDTTATSSQSKRNDRRAHRHHHDRERKEEMKHTESVEQKGSGKNRTKKFGSDGSDDSDVDPIPSIPPIVSVALSPSKWKARVAALVRDDSCVNGHHHRAQNQTQSNNENLTAATTAEAVHLLSIVLEREAAREAAAHKYAVKLQRSITALRHTVVRAAPMLQFQATGPRRMTTLGHLQFCFNKMAPIATSSSSPAFEPSAPSVPASVPHPSKNMDSVTNGRNDDDVDAPSTTKSTRESGGGGEECAALPLHEVFKEFVSRKTRSDASPEDGAAPHESSDTEPDDLSLAMTTAVCLAASTFLSCPIPTTASEGPGPEPTRSSLSMLFSELAMDHVTAFSLQRNGKKTDPGSTNQQQADLPNGALFFLDTTAQRSTMKRSDTSFSSLLNDVLRSMTAAGLAATTTPSPSAATAATASQPPREAAEPIGCQLLHRLRRCITSPEDARAHLTQEAVALLLRVFALWLSVPLHVSQEIGHVDNIGEILGEHALIVVKSLQDEERGSVHRLCDIQLGSFSHAAHCGGADRAPSKVAVDLNADAPSSTIAPSAITESAPTDMALRRPTLRELFLQKTAKKKKTSDGDDRKHEDVDAEEIEVEDDRSIGFSMMRLRSTTSSSVSMSMPGSSAADVLSEQEAIQGPRNSLGTDDNGATKAEAAPVSRVGRGRGRGRRLHGALASSSPSTSPSKQKSHTAVPESVKVETLPAASALPSQHTKNAFAVGAASEHGDGHVEKFEQPVVSVTGTRPLLAIHRQRIVTREDFDVFLSAGSNDSSGAAGPGPFNLRGTAVEDKKETANPDKAEPIPTSAADGAAAATMTPNPSSVIEVSSLFEAAVFLHTTTARLALFCLKAFPAALPPAAVDTPSATHGRASWSAEVAELMSVREAMASSVSKLSGILEWHVSSSQEQRRNKGPNTGGANEGSGAACEDEDAVAPPTGESRKSLTLEAALRDIRELCDLLK